MLPPTMMIASGALLAASLIAASAAQAQTVWYVNDDGNAANGCTSWPDACPELQTALSLANAGDQIWVAEGTYKPDYDVKTGQHTNDREASFHLISGVALYGGFDSTETTLEDRAGLFDDTIFTGDLLGNDTPVANQYEMANDPNRTDNSYHVVVASGTEDTAILDGFRISGGHASGVHGSDDEDGGGVFCNRGSPTITNCLITDNFADHGGGLWFYRNSDARITKCSITGNFATSGGGISSWLSSPIITDCTISGNFGSGGAGVLIWDSDLTLSNCRVVDNTSDFHGGGIVITGEGNPVITDCLITGNTGVLGGGLSCVGYYGTIRNCLIIGNTAFEGGGLWTAETFVAVTNSVIANNTANTGGGVYCWADSFAAITNCTITQNTGGSTGGIWCSADAKPTVEQSILWDNNGAEITTSGACEITVRYSDVQGGEAGVGGSGTLIWEEGNIDAAPLLVDPAGEDFHLQPVSPCVDAGDPVYEPEEDEIDIDGESRVFNDRVDIGADEYQDCNGNGVADYLDIAEGTSEDCTANAIPDECEPDCNDNGVADSCDISNHVSEDCTANSIPDECEPDCNNNGVADSCDLDNGTSDDCNGNGVPDECIELENDCNSNGTPDECDTAKGSSDDCDGNSIPDECEDTSADCNKNGVWDPCDLADPASDADRDGTLDECETLILLFVDDDAPGDPGPGDPSASDPGEDGSSEHPFDAIQEAIDGAKAIEDETPGQNYLVEIAVADGTYVGSGNKDIVFHGLPYLVRTANGPNTCVVDCEGTGRGFHFALGETGGTRLQGLTITNGSADEGGGIYCNGSSPTITDCFVTTNEATLGGGIFCDNGSSPTIRNCSISGNTAAAGGGIYCLWSDPTITGCSITGNTALFFQGGGISLGFWSDATITNCMFLQNSADSAGGGVSCHDVSNAIISDCLFAQNSAELGGGIWYRESHPTITNCTILQNSAELVGGGIVCSSSGSSTISNCLIAGNTVVNYYGGGISSGNCTDLTITNCTITGNVGPEGSGGGLWTFDGFLTLSNSIVWANTPQEVIAENYAKITVNHSDVQGGQENFSGEIVLIWGEGNIDADPLFIDPDGPDDDPSTWEDNDYHLSAGSPCIDAADNSAVPADESDLDDDGDTSEPIPLDLDGNPRFIDDPLALDTGAGDCPIVDMGALEFQDGTTTCCPVDLDGDGAVGASDLAELLGSWGPCEGCPADLDGNGQVGPFDLALLLGNWGVCD